MFTEISKESFPKHRLTSVTIENFMGIGDAVTIPIHPITLLFGKNSAGKSTVLRALRYCEAILKYALNPSRLQIKLSGGHTINLADFPSLVHRHELDRKIRMRIDFSDINGIANMWYEIVTAWKEGQLNLELVGGLLHNDEEICRFGYTSKPPGDTIFGTNGEGLIRLEKKEGLAAEGLVIYVSPKFFFTFEDDKIEDFLNVEDLPFGSNKLLQAFRDCISFIFKKTDDLPSRSTLLKVFRDYLNALDIIKNIKFFETFQKALKNIETEKNFYELLEELEKNMSLIEIIMVMHAFQLVQLESLYSSQESKELDNPSFFKAQNIFFRLIKIRHLGPLREVPQTPNKLWEKGFGAWYALARDPELVEKTNHYIQDILKLGGYSINQANSDEGFYLHDEDNNIDIGLSDVGVGISQVIPVVVGVLDVLDDSHEIFAVEQPELHLHPAAQVALGDVFIDGIKNSNRPILIETHSEHLLLRIMRRMRETFEDRIEENRFPVTPDDVVVLFVEWHDSQTIIREMPVNERGELVKAWPGGFFEEDIEEVFA